MSVMPALDIASDVAWNSEHPVESIDGCNRLWGAVIKDTHHRAISDTKIARVSEEAMRQQARAQREAKEWLAGDGFEWICGGMNINPDVIRDAMRRAA